MKAAIYVEDGVTQIALTAETEWEKLVLAQIDGQDLTVYRGGFYACHGGWIREEPAYSDSMFTGSRDRPPDSLMFRINKTTEPPRG